MRILSLQAGFQPLSETGNDLFLDAKALDQLQLLQIFLHTGQHLLVCQTNFAVAVFQHRPQQRHYAGKNQSCHQRQSGKGRIQNQRRCKRSDQPGELGCQRG